MKRTTMFVAAAGIAAAGVVIAGPLNPPAGPVASTYKTLNEVEPRIPINATTAPGDADSTFKISSTGSYYLTGNVDCIPGKKGIEIGADDVTIDLNGFRIGGYPGALSGIEAIGTNRRGITIRNGSIWTMGGTGIDLLGNGALAATRGFRIEDVTVMDCGTGGIMVSNSGLVSHVVCSGNGGNGIYAAGETRIVGCTVTTCHVGIQASNSTTIEGCVVSKCDTDDIGAGARCVIRDNQCDSNGTAVSNGAGIRVFGSGTRIEGNTCTFNDRGISVESAGCLIVRNSCTGIGQWVIAAGNVYGPIVDRSNVSTPAVNGSSAADVTTTSNPNANFTF